MVKTPVSTSSPESEIRSRIARRGRISFAEFMETALYHPKGGYYTGPSPLGAEGDYFTSPAAHPAFGALIALQLLRMWEMLGSPSQFFAVEMGAGAGLLARDLLRAASSMMATFRRALRYLALERYAGVESLTTAPCNIQRVVADRVPLKPLVGCFISNELVDSFPVHRFQIRGGSVYEVYVAAGRDGQFVEILGEPSSPLLAQRLERLPPSLPEGFQGEVSLNVGPWMRDVAAALERGFVVTIDYGHEAGEMHGPQGAGGGLRTYYRHAPGGSPYRRIGAQDITAPVDFTLVASEGEAVGLRPVALLTQSRFLRDLGFDAMMRRLRALDLGQRERDANMMAMRELVKPDGLGGFKVLIQEKDTGIEGLKALIPTEASTPELEVLLLGPEHIPLMEGRYPHLAWEPEALWPPAPATRSGPSEGPQA